VNNIYDIGIIGGGISGAFASLRIAENYKNAKAILFELGRPPLKRRRQLEGWLGCFPFGDGKLHLNDVEDIMQVVDGRKAQPANKWVQYQLSKAGPMKVIKNRTPNVSVKNTAENMMFELYSNDYIQWVTDNIHNLSRQMSNSIEEAGNVEFSFDNEVFQILKKEDYFLVTTQKGDFMCRKVLISVGRSGWRWVTDLYKSFGLLNSENDSYAKYGIRVEIPKQHMKEFNKSHCSFIRDDLEIGPLSWNGAIIPEDHADVAISAFRSNEGRWQKLGKNKVSFNLIGNRYFPGKGVFETERLGKLAFIMCDDRIGREKIKLIMNKESKLSKLPEYDWLIETIKELEELFPFIITKGYYHAPTILPMAPSILLGVNLESELDGVFAAGESAGFKGIMSAAISGVIAADGALK
jgi:uncharacterized FAD-dependent dehydrogenase